MKIAAIMLFISTYVLLLAFPKIRAYTALLSALIFVCAGILPVSDAFFEIDWNVILMIAGTMGVVYLFIESKMPALLADMTMKNAERKVGGYILSLFSGIVSAFIDNVATVLMIAPIAVVIAKA